MDTIEWLEKVLEESVKRRGEVPLTNAHLLNCVKMAKRAKDTQDIRVESRLNEALAEDRIWGA